MKTLKPLVFLCALTAALNGCTAHTKSVMSPSRAPLGSVRRATPTPKQEPTPTQERFPAQTPIPAQTPTPTIAPTSAPTVTPSAPIRAADAAPEIIDVSLDHRVASAGQILHGAVTTSSNVASVEMRIASYSIPMTKTGVGHFTVAYPVPSLPFFLHRTYTLAVIARNTQGVEASRELPITIR